MAHPLVQHARESIERFLRSDTLPLPRDLASYAGRQQGVFVTLRKHGALRGCIGRIVPDRPIPELVSTIALQAALKDPRFPPLTESELGEVEVEVSLLTPLRHVGGPAEIEVGRHGVLMRKGGRSAVFLPEVATEQGWTRDQTLEQLSLKAGLPRDAWRSGAEMFVFEAEVFRERPVK